MSGPQPHGCRCCAWRDHALSAEARTDNHLLLLLLLLQVLMV
jgi:hypothetical protein